MLRTISYPKNFCDISFPNSNIQDHRGLKPNQLLRFCRCWAPGHSLPRATRSIDSTSQSVQCSNRGMLRRLNATFVRENFIKEWERRGRKVIGRTRGSLILSTQSRFPYRLCWNAKSLVIQKTGNTFMQVPPLVVRGGDSCMLHHFGKILSIGM